jgi:hypothetical protein
MSQHKESGLNHTKITHSKQCQSNHTHVSNTTILDQFFKINLSQSRQTLINKANQRQTQNQRSIICICISKQRQIKTQ